MCCWLGAGTLPETPSAQGAVRRARELGAVPMSPPGMAALPDDASSFVDMVVTAIGGHHEYRAAFVDAIAKLDDGNQARGSLARALRRMLAGEKAEDLIADSGPAAPMLASIAAAMSPRSQDEAEDSAGDIEEAADRLDRLGMAYATQGRFEEAIGCLRRAVAIWETLGRPLERAMTGNNLAATLRSAGRLEEAAAGLEQSLSFDRQAGERLKEATAW
jgi:tetratricopeptide (TPR) repeat protein